MPSNSFEAKQIESVDPKGHLPAPATAQRCQDRPGGSRWRRVGFIGLPAVACRLALSASVGAGFRNVSASRTACAPCQPHQRLRPMQVCLLCRHGGSACGAPISLAHPADGAHPTRRAHTRALELSRVRRWTTGASALRCYHWIAADACAIGGGEAHELGLERTQVPNGALRPSAVFHHGAPRFKRAEQVPFSNENARTPARMCGPIRSICAGARRVCIRLLASRF
jgi:hypothetical protein